MPDPKAKQKWKAKNNADDIVTVVSVTAQGVRFTYDGGGPGTESLMVLSGFLRFFEKV